MYFYYFYMRMIKYDEVVENLSCVDVCLSIFGLVETVETVYYFFFECLNRLMTIQLVSCQM